MGKLITFLMFTFVSLQFLFQIMEGSNGAGNIATTRLSSPLSASATSMDVIATGDFPPVGYVILDEERINYTAKTATTLTGLTRGATWHGDTTSAKPHGAGVKVHNEASFALNEAAGNRLVSSANLGIFSIPIPSAHFFSHTIPQALAWDYSFFDGPAGIIRMVLLYPLSAGILIAFLALATSAIQGLFKVG
jgi:hypothetical protein